jgi:hypothetical protein
MNRLPKEVLIDLLIYALVLGVLFFLLAACDTTSAPPDRYEVTLESPYVSMSGETGSIIVKYEATEPARLTVTLNIHVVLVDTTVTGRRGLPLDWKTAQGWGHPPIGNGDTFSASLEQANGTVVHDAITLTQRLPSR